MPAPDRISPNEWIRAYHKEFTKGYKHFPFMYRDLLKVLIEKLQDIAYLNSENEVVNVTKVFANQERAIAAMSKAETTILPIISVSQKSTASDKERVRPRVKLIYDTMYSPDKGKSYRVISASPTAVNITYSINIWARYMSDLDQILEQIRLMFNPAIQITTSDLKFDFPCFLGNELDSSDIEVKSQEDRTIERSIDLEVQGYVPQPKFLVTSTGKIELIGVDFDINKVE